MLILSSDLRPSPTLSLFFRFSG